MTRMALLLAGAALFAAAPRDAQAQQAHRFRCESRDYRQHLCRVDSRDQVTLSRVLSDQPCVRNRSWWVTREGVVVSNGCRGEFVAYDRRNGGYGNGNGNWGGYDNGNRGRGRDYDDRWGRNNNNDNSDWWRRNASNLCRREVSGRVGGSQSVQTWVRDQDRNSVELGWRSGRYDSGTCRVDDRGRVRVHVDRSSRDQHRYHN